MGRLRRTQPAAIRLHQCFEISWNTRLLKIRTPSRICAARRVGSSALTANHTVKQKKGCGSPRFRNMGSATLQTFTPDFVSAVNDP